MHINLSQEFINFIDQNVQSGFYANSAEVVREALRRMKKQQLQEQYWREQVQIGLDELDAGLGRPLNMEELKREVLKELNTTKKPNKNNAAKQKISNNNIS